MGNEKGNIKAHAVPAITVDIFAQWFPEHWDEEFYPLYSWERQRHLHLRDPCINQAYPSSLQMQVGQSQRDHNFNLPPIYSNLMLTLLHLQPLNLIKYIPLLTLSMASLFWSNSWQYWQNLKDFKFLFKAVTTSQNSNLRRKLFVCVISNTPPPPQKSLCLS